MEIRTNKKTANPAGESNCILVVDDSRLERLLLKRMLIRGGYEVLTAGGSDEALALLERTQPDLILLDICMPGLDGYDLCAAIRELPGMLSTPVIFISSNNSREDRVRAFASGGVDYLNKPIEYKETLARIATHLSLHNLRRNLEARVKARTAELEASNLRLIGEIAERRSVEDRLQQRNALVNCLVDANIVGIMFLRNDGRLIDANKAFLDLFGLQREDIQAGLITWQQLVPPEENDSTIFALGLVKETGYCLPYEKYCRKIDGTVFPVLIGSARLTGDDVCISFVLDITERKRMEESLLSSREHIRDLAAHGEAAMEQERKRIAREIHDEQGSLLTALKLELALLKRDCTALPAEASERIMRLQTLADETIRVMRQVASQLRPAALNLGLIPSLEWLTNDFRKRTGINCHLHSDTDIVLDDAKATALFRIVQESLTNVTKHANASDVDISLEQEERQLGLCVNDNGCGFDPFSIDKQSFGLRGISERLELLGGSLLINSTPGLGTSLQISIPLDQD